MAAVGSTIHRPGGHTEMLDSKGHHDEHLEKDDEYQLRVGGA